MIRTLLGFTLLSKIPPSNTSKVFSPVRGLAIKLEEKQPSVYGAEVS